ncbi:glycosyltransferase [Rhizobium helianthi]|uniref:Glycosyltransferase n=1 Tax=Rhizobium helianthi TaxID=1132695 RepID=A0ABW4M238_9HYPH
MVEARQLDALKQNLEAGQYESADSSPARLSHPLPYQMAPRVLIIFMIISCALLVLFNYAVPFRRFFPDGDLLFSHYAGNYSVPLRLFILSFFVAFASAVDGSWWVRVAFGLDLVLSFLLISASFDLWHFLLGFYTGLQISHIAAQLSSALVGFLLFSLILLERADMPLPNPAPRGSRYRLTSLVTSLVILVISAATSAWVSAADFPIIANLRSGALLGGVNVGIFLLIPLVFFLLNLLASIQNILRKPGPFAPDITLIVPTFNEAHTVEALISATDQAARSYPGKVTMVLVDNSSTDDTERRAREAFDQTSSLAYEILTEPRRGKSFALNTGLAHVKTEYFARLDADTLVSPDALVRAFAHFSNPHMGVVGGLAIPPGGGPFDGPRMIEILLKMGYDQVALGACDGIFGIPGMFACYRTKAARDVGGFAIGLNGEDTDIALRIGEAGYRLFVDPQVTFISEVPRTLNHLREQRHRWFRSIFHVTARNRQYLFPLIPSVRGWFVIPYMLANTARRAMAMPLLLFAVSFLLLHDPAGGSTITLASVVALLLGAPFLNALLAILINLRFKAILYLPFYILFRMLRSYFTLEALLSLNFRSYSAKLGEAVTPVEEGPGASGVVVLNAYRTS